MEIRSSYFYHVRNFHPWMLPVSTTMFDPKWYHRFKGNQDIFRDKRGVVNGVRAEGLVPGPDLAGLCEGTKNPVCDLDSSKCSFLRRYREQVDKIDFKMFMNELEKTGQWLIRQLKIDREPVIVLMFHEKPDNPCSEREVLKEWFRDHGMELKELEYPIV